MNRVWALILCGQSRGEVGSVEPGESQFGESNQTVAASGEDFQNLQVTRPLSDAQLAVAVMELASFLLRGAESEVGRFLDVPVWLEILGKTDGNGDAGLC